MKHFTDSLLEQNLLSEASDLSQEEKMDLWHQGRRNQNIKASSDDKLRANFNICARKGYTKEAELLRDEAKIRGLWWGQQQPQPAKPSQPTPVAPKPAQNSTSTLTLYPLEEGDFELSFAEQVSQSADDRDKLRALATDPRKTLTALVIAITLKEDLAISVLKDRLLEWPVDKANIKQILLGCMQDPIKSRIGSILSALLAKDEEEDAEESTEETAPVTPVTPPTSAPVAKLIINDISKPGTKCFVVHAAAKTQTGARRQLKFRGKLPGTDTYNIMIEGAENDTPIDCRVLFESAQQATDFIHNLGKAKTTRPWQSYTYNIATYDKPNTFDLSTTMAVKTVCGPARMLKTCQFRESLNFTEAIEKHDALNTKLWTEEAVLRDEVKEKIGNIVAEFVNGLAQDEIKIVVKDILLIGSNCSYNYTDTSDLDIHIIADTSQLQCQDNLYPALYGAYRSLFSRKFDIDFYGIPVELYVETEETKTISNGIYSVMNGAWVKDPVKEAIPEIDQKAFSAEFEKWELAYNKLMKKSEDILEEPKKAIEKALDQKIKDVETADLDQVLDTIETEVKEKAEEAGVDRDTSKETAEPDSADLPETAIKLQIEQFINDLYTLRKHGLATEGEYGIGNLIFKEMRNKGYLDALKELKNKLVSQSLSLKDDKKPEEENLKEATTQAEILRSCKIKIERIVHSQAIVMPNGKFQVYLVKEPDVQGYVEELKRLECVEKASASASGKYDFSHVGPNKVPNRYFTITGQIKL